MKPIRVEPEAKEELAAAAAWYETRRERPWPRTCCRGRRRARRNRSKPDSFPFYPRVAAYFEVRRAPAGRFPYSVAFIDTGPAIRVIAIAHDRRRPRYWAGRLV